MSAEAGASGDCAAVREHQAAVIERAVEEWYSGSWAYGVRCTSADRERLVWVLTRRLGLQPPDEAPTATRGDEKEADRG